MRRATLLHHEARACARAASFGALALGVIIYAGACSDGGSSSPALATDAGSVADSSQPALDGATPQSISVVQDFCDRTVKPLADAFAACCSKKSRGTAVYATASAPITKAAANCGSALGASVASGHAVFDRDAAARCEGQIVAVIASGNACWAMAPRNSPPPAVFAIDACAEVIRGMGNEGASCRSGVECASGLGCVKDVCSAPPSAYSECAGEDIDWGFGAHPRCAADAFCDATGMCKPRRALGDRCAADSECAAGSACRFGVCGTTEQLSAGGPCVRDGDCREGLYCQRSSSAAIGICRPRKSAGQRCEGAALASDCAGVCESGTCASFCGSN